MSSTTQEGNRDRRETPKSKRQWEETHRDREKKVIKFLKFLMIIGHSSIEIASKSAFKGFSKRKKRSVIKLFRTRVKSERSPPLTQITQSS